jgi:hypothetical protein
VRFHVRHVRMCSSDKAGVDQTFNKAESHVTLIVVHPNSGPSKSTLMTTEDTARIQPSEAKRSGGGVTTGSFAARAQVRN